MTKKIGHVAKDDLNINVVDLAKPTGVVSIAVHDYTNQCVATVHVAGSGITHLQMYSASSYKIDVESQEGPGNDLPQREPPQMPGHNGLQTNHLERIVDQFTYAMRLVAREVVVNSPEHPELRQVTEQAVRKIVELVMSYRVAPVPTEDGDPPMDWWRELGVLEGKVNRMTEQLYGDGSLKVGESERFGPVDLWRRLNDLSARVGAFDGHTHSIVSGSNPLSPYQIGAPIARSPGG